jgi:hypothetical protein
MAIATMVSLAGGFTIFWAWERAYWRRRRVQPRT